jgi:hypothetical protein
MILRVLYPLTQRAGLTIAEKVLTTLPPLLPQPLLGPNGRTVCPPVHQVLHLDVSCRTRDPRVVFPFYRLFLHPSEGGHRAKYRTEAQRGGHHGAAQVALPYDHSRSRPQRANDGSREKGLMQSETRLDGQSIVLPQCEYR